MRKRPLLSIVVFTLIIIIAIIAAASIGIVSVPIEVVLQIILSKFGLYDSTQIDTNLYLTISELRLPRILMSLIVGASLSVAGVVFQAIFRNPLCDPYILGISSGASIGAATAFILGLDTLFFGVTLAAFAAALLTLLFIMGIVAISHKNNTQTILLTGITVNFFISAIITLLIVLNHQEMHKIIFWTMGSLANTTYPQLLLFFILALLCITLLFIYSKELTIIQLGSNTAKSLGVNAERLTILLLIISSMLIACAVSLCGVIGFIGLIIPNLVRIIWGNNVRKLLTYSIFFGAFFLLIADTIARSLTPNADLPVGSITAIAGAPYFIFLLLKNKKNHFAC